MRFFINPIAFILLIVFIIWIASLLAITQSYRDLSRSDVYLIKDFIIRGYSSYNRQDFFKTLWDNRPSLLSLKVKDESSSVIYSSYRRVNKWEYFSFFQYATDVSLILKNGKPLKVFLVYATLPLEELYYYSFVSLCLLILFFLLYFFSIFWKSF